VVIYSNCLRFGSVTIKSKKSFLPARRYAVFAVVARLDVRHTPVLSLNG